MKTIIVLASVLASVCGTAIKREPYYGGYPAGYYPSYNGGYGYGYAPQDITANQNSNAYGGYGSNVIADGSANGYGQRFKREPQYPRYGYPGYGYGGYRPQAVTANQESNAVGGAGSTVVASGTSIAGAERVKREPQYYNGFPIYGNQASNPYGGSGSTGTMVLGTANARGKRLERSPQGYGYPNYGYPGYGYTGYGYGGYRPQTVTANQASNAVGGAGSTVVASGTSTAGAERVKREPQYYNGYPGYGYGPYGGYRPQTVTANQESNAVGGAGSTVVASGISHAGAQRVKREPQYYNGYSGNGYGQYGGHAPQSVAANQVSNAVGGYGSTVAAIGSANASGSRWKREPYPQGYPYSDYYGYYPYNYQGIAPQRVTANQVSNAAGGDGSTVVSSGTSNAGGSMQKRQIIFHG